MQSNKSNRQKIGFWSIVLLGINAIIGSGIFLLPSVGMKTFGPASILVLFFDTFLALVIALCFAECANYFDKTGGPYLYAKEAFGDFVGYEVGIIAWVIHIIAEATIYVALATALGGLFPALASPLAKNIIVTVVGLSLMAINLSGVKLTTAINNVVTVSKLIPLLLLIIVGIFFIKPTNFQPFFIPKLTHTTNFADAAITMFYIFTGFEALGVIAGDMKNAKKNLPKALIISFAAVATIYILIMVVSIGVLGNSLSGSAVPLQATFEKIAGGFGGAVISLGTILSAGGIAIAASFVTPRAGLALAENGMMPKKLALNNKKGSPYVSILVSSAITLTIAYSGSFTLLAQISAVSRFAQFIPTCIAVLVFRRTKKLDPHAFRIPFGPLVPVLALGTSFWLLYYVKLSNLVLGLGALVLAIPFYFLTKRSQHSTQTKVQENHAY